MKYLTTVVLAAVLTAGCGGGGGGGGSEDSGESTDLFESLMPLEDTAIGTIWTFQIDREKNHPQGGVSNKSVERRFKFGVIEDPTGPDIYTVTQINGAGDPVSINHIGVRRTTESLEVMLFDEETITRFGAIDTPFDVAIVMPGVAVAKNEMVEGSTFTSTVSDFVTDYLLEWIGPESISGYPDAHRFDFSLEIPHAFATVTVVGVAHVVPDVGLVRVVATKSIDFGGGATTVKYTANLTDTEGP